MSYRRPTFVLCFNLDRPVCLNGLLEHPALDRERLQQEIRARQQTGTDRVRCVPRAGRDSGRIYALIGKIRLMHGSQPTRNRLDALDYLPILPVTVPKRSVPLCPANQRLPKVGVP